MAGAGIAHVGSVSYANDTNRAAGGVGDREEREPAGGVGDRLGGVAQNAKFARRR
jgi:hypothetical protein